MVFVRTYRVRVPPQRVDAYLSFEREEGVPMVAAQPGCLRAGFARVVEAEGPTFIFYSEWTDPGALERARSTPEWRRAAGRLEGLDLTLGGDVAEHWDVVAQAQGAGAKPLSETRA
jgi:quinol monooxygenase YgiN